MIDDAQGHGDGGGTMRFTLWPAQVRVMWALMTTRLVIVLKARQLGISWICCSYALWLCLFHPGKVVLLFSKSLDDATELLRRIKALYDRLPDWMRQALPAITKSNTEQLVFANGSRVESESTGKQSGRGKTASLVMLDEAAFQMWADTLYTALKPTIDGGGQLIVISTANGLGNLFHRLWTRGVAGLNTFQTIFLPWWARPGRDAAWYQTQLDEYTDPQMVKQEYPATANEAFITSGRARFKSEWIAAQAGNVRAPLAVAALPAKLHSVPGLSVYALPVAGTRYVLGADVAEGGEQGDYSTATLIDAATWEEMATIHGQWEPSVYAGYLHTLAAVYDAEIAPERNNHGHAVMVALRNLPNRHRLVRGHDDKPGWLTNAQTKPLTIDGLAAALMQGLATVRTQATLDELQIYATLESGKTSAPEGYHDDRVMAWAIAIEVAKRESTVETLPVNPFYTDTAPRTESIWGNTPW